MAQITWRNIDAPHLSTRDLSLAGGQITDAFDRLGQQLFQREASLREQATDAALADVHMAATPEEIAALRARGLDHLDPRVNRLAVAQGLGQVEGQIMDRRVKQNDLTRFDAEQWAGRFAPELLTAAGRLDDQGYAATMARMQADPRFQDYAFAAQDMIHDSQNLRGDADTRRMTGERDAEDARANRAREANDAARLRLQSEQYRLDRESRAAQDRGYEAAFDFATRYRLDSTESAEAKLVEDADFRALPPDVKRAIQSNFRSAHTAMTAETDDIRMGLGDLDSRIQTQLRALEAAGNRAENQTRAADAQAARRAMELSGTVDVQDVTAQMAELGPYWTQGTAKTEYDKWAAEFKDKGLDMLPEDVSAAIEQYGLSSNLFSTVFGGSNEDNMLKENIERVIRARDRGYSQNIETDIATARAPIESTKAAIEQLRRNAAAWMRANPNQELPENYVQQFDQLLQRLPESERRQVSTNQAMGRTPLP